jgi:hypothetical protein
VKPRLLYGVALWCVVFFALVPSLCAQGTAVRRHIGAVQDWSQSHIVFSRDALARQPDLIDREPRIRQQLMQRWQAPNGRASHKADPLSRPAKKFGLGHDWSVTSLGSRLRINMFPAKYTFDPLAPPDCTNDYVVIGLPIAGALAVDGTGGQANLVAFNNLYSGTDPTGACGTGPAIMFAYNVTTVPGGEIVTSPVPSLDGTQIAFVESVPANTGQGIPASTIFHVLTWTAGEGTIGDPAPPLSMTTSMTSLPLTVTATSTTSSPWVDFSADTAYLGDDVGNVYQVTPVFNGTPLLSAGWPVLVSSPYHLTAPVLDSGRGLLMVGSDNGDLYQIDTSTATVSTPLVVGKANGTTSGIVGPPIVDVTNGTTFVVSPNATSSAVLVEADTESLVALSTAHIGVGSSGGTHLHIFQPAFSNAYYNDPSTGVVSLCGTGTGTDTSPWQYEYGFTTGRVMNETPVSGFPVQLSTSTTDRCTGWTELFNPNAGPGDTITAVSILSDVLIVSANNNNLVVGEKVFIQGTGESFLNGQTVTVASLIGSGPTYSGFAASFTYSGSYSNSTDTGEVSAIDTITAVSISSNLLTVTASNTNLTVGEQLYIQGTAENFLNGQTVTVASLIGSAPLYTGFTANFTYSTTYSNPSDTGTASAGTDYFFFGLTGDCTLVGGSGASGSGCVVALANYNGTTTVTTSEEVDNGPSGIVVDNYATANQASSIYLTSLATNTVAHRLSTNDQRLPLSHSMERCHSVRLNCNGLHFSFNKLPDSLRKLLRVIALLFT